MTLKMMGKTDVTVGRATAARRGVGRVHHLDARISWLQQLCAEGVMESRFRPGDHDEADLESKMIDSIVLSKGTPHRPPMSSMSWELTDGGSKFHRGCRGSKRLSCVNLEREERMQDEWLVPDLWRNGHRHPDGVVRRTIWDFHFR